MSTAKGSSISWSVVETLANPIALSFDIRAELIRSFSSVGWRVESTALRKAACGTPDQRLRSHDPVQGCLPPQALGTVSRRSLGRPPPAALLALDARALKTIPRTDTGQTACFPCSQQSAVLRQARHMIHGSE